MIFSNFHPPQGYRSQISQLSKSFCFTFLFCWTLWPLGATWQEIFQVKISKGESKYIVYDKSYHSRLSIFQNQYLRAGCFYPEWQMKKIGTCYPGSELDMETDLWTGSWSLELIMEWGIAADLHNIIKIPWDFILPKKISAVMARNFERIFRFFGNFVGSRNLTSKAEVPGCMRRNQGFTRNSWTMLVHYGLWWIVAFGHQPPLEHGWLNQHKYEFTEGAC